MLMNPNFPRRIRVPGLVCPDTYAIQDLVENGDFVSDVSGWSATSPSTIAYYSGTCRLSRNSAPFGTDMMYQDIEVIPGQYYLAQLSFVYQEITTVYGNFSVTGGSVMSGFNFNDPYNSAHALVLATGSTLRLIFKSANNYTAKTGWDNISLRPIYYKV